VAEKNRRPYLGVAFALYKVHQQGFRYLFSPFWKSPDISEALPPMLNSLPAGEAPEERGDLPGEDRLGREMAAAWTEAGKAAGLPGGPQRRVRAGAKELLGPDPESEIGHADAVFCAATPPDGMTMIKTNEGAELHAQADLFSSARRSTDLDEESWQGRRHVMLAPWLAPRG